MPRKRSRYWRIGDVEAPTSMPPVREARRTEGVRREPVYQPTLYAEGSDRYSLVERLRNWIFADQVEES